MSRCGIATKMLKLEKVNVGNEYTNSST